MLLSHEKTQKINHLIAKKKYPAAVAILKEHLKNDPKNVLIRKQLGELLPLAGKPKAGLKIMLGLVKEFTDEGYITKALALLKKMERDYPDRSEAIHRCTVELTRRHDETYYGIHGLDLSEENPENTPDHKAAQPQEHKEGLATPLPDYLKTTQPEPEPKPKGKHPKRRRTDIDPATVPRRRQMDLEIGPPKRRRKLETQVEEPLFDFPCSQEELFSLFKGLELQSHGPGEIICSEGEPGGSLMIIASGTLRVYVRDKRRTQREVRLLHEGAFFGEISLLTGKPRSATCVSVYDVDLLVLEKPVLADIAKQHPDLLPILKAYYLHRANSPEEQEARNQGVTN